ncbi:DnaJ-domain-containing protein [Auriculariales sp. MPI-PUGE-AT-0066]|nr:DnaJ-domain-containing protein [Auriculariales sp. MPI-PUGE-AT-0066]
MGANSSRAGGAGSGSEGTQTGPAVPDYYAVLEVDEAASADEIKKSYRKLALVYHPDKNRDDPEAATQRFREIQAAYEVLGDEKEREWYDQHRNALAPEADAETVFEDIRRGAAPPRARDRGLTTKHVLMFFDPRIFAGFGDDSNSFYTIYGNLFKRLAAEEEGFGGHPATDIPTLGQSDWPWAAPRKGDEPTAARTFYNYWSSFLTEKDFNWADQWNVNEAPDRRVRRLMERDNKKAREDARKEYNDAVRQLTLFIRKRDPRYKTHLASQQQQQVIATKGKPSQSSGTSTPRPAAPVEEFVEQEWQKVKPPRADRQDDWAEAEGEGEEWECVACGRSFRSEAAWSTHERSRKHLKAVEQLRREMMKENAELGLDLDSIDDEDDHPELEDDGGSDEEPPTTPPEVQENSRPPTKKPAADNLDNSDEELDRNAASQRAAKARKRERKKAKAKPFTESETASPAGVATPTEEQDEDDDAANTEIGAAPQMSKKDKRRAREAAKKAKEQQVATPTLVCNACSETFDSRTQLFTHITRTGHAQAEPEPQPSSVKVQSQSGKRKKRQ